MQILYLSNRPAVLLETLSHVRRFMPWVGDAVVVAPPACMAELTGTPGLVPVDERELSGAAESDLAALDHVSRNIHLRRAAIRSGLVADTFILSDDDYRPLRPVDREFFVQDGRLHSYWCYDLSHWRRTSTDFDRAQHLTYQALLHLGCPHLGYGSHQPQVMDRAILSEAFEALGTLTDSEGVCEWTLFANWGRARHPGYFHPPRVFETLAWPRYPNEWPFFVRPSRHTFENHYPELYADGQLFAGLPTAAPGPEDDRTARLAFERSLRWYRYELETSSLRYASVPGNPWTGSRLRRLGFGVLEVAARFRDRVAAEDRRLLEDLAGRLTTLEQLTAVTWSGDGKPAGTDPPEPETTRPDTVGPDA